MPSRFVFLFLLLMSSGAFAQAKSFYDVLGVLPAVETSVIKSTWKKKIAQLHPDRFQGEPDKAEAATEQLKILNDAASVISRPAMRAYYDLITREGAQHMVWARMTGIHLDALEKKYGPAQDLPIYRKKNPAPVTERPAPATEAPLNEAKPENPIPEPAPETAKPQSSSTELLNQIFPLLADPQVSDQVWKSALAWYQEHPAAESDPARQSAGLRILTQALPDWKVEALAQALVQKFEISDDRIRTQLWQIIRSPDPRLRRVGIFLTFQILVNERTDLLRMDSAQTKELLRHQSMDPSEGVRKQAFQALEALQVAPPPPPPLNQAQALRGLSSHDLELRKRSFHYFQNSMPPDAEVIEVLLRELRKRQVYYDRTLSSAFNVEMKTILHWISKSSDATLFASDLADFRNQKLPNDVRAAAVQAWNQASWQPASAWLIRCHKIFH